MIESFYCAKYNAICMDGTCNQGHEILKHEAHHHRVDFSTFDSAYTVQRMVTRTDSTLTLLSDLQKQSLSIGSQLPSYNKHFEYTLPKHFGFKCHSIWLDYQASGFEREEREIKQISEEYLTNYRMKLPLDRLPTYECSCEACQEFCQSELCYATPDEIINIIDRGYADRLMLAYCEDEIIVVPAREGYEGKAAPYPLEGGCTFFKGGKCVINHLKPIKGRLSIHDVDVDSRYNTDKKIAEMWNTDQGYNLRKLWESLVKCDGYPEREQEEEYWDW